jgi:hypothetical protein
MTNYPRPSETDLGELERMSAESTMADALMAQSRESGPSKALSLRTLYRHASGEGHLAEHDLESIYAAGPTFRAAYQRMLRAFSLFYFPSVRAAGTAWAPHREVAGCQIDLDEDEGQLFVTVELPRDLADVPRSLTILGKSGVGRRVTLPEALRGVIHFPIVGDDELIKLLRDPDSEVYLA